MGKECDCGYELSGREFSGHLSGCPAAQPPAPPGADEAADAAEDHHVENSEGDYRVEKIKRAAFAAGAAFERDRASKEIAGLKSALEFERRDHKETIDKNIAIQRKLEDAKQFAEEMRQTAVNLAEKVAKLEWQLKQFAVFGTSECYGCQGGRITLFVANQKCTSCDPKGYDTYEQRFPEAVANEEGRDGANKVHPA